MTAPPAPTISLAEIVDVSLPLLRPFRSGTTAMTDRRLLLIRLETDAAVGWGECGPIPGYSAEGVEECRTWLTARLQTLVEGAPDEAGPGPASARFGLSAALADLAATQAGVPLWRAIGATREHIPIGAVIGLEPDLTDLPAIAVGLADEGYRRIKLKVDRHSGIERIAAVRAALPGHDLAVDANGTLDPGDLSTATAFDGFGLSFIEQPFPAAALTAHAALRSSIATPVCLDESITDFPSAARAIDVGAATVINIKPARVGGLAEAVAIHDLALAAGWEAWCGGMLESGIGKAAALAVAGLPGMTLPADLPPSARHYATDLVESVWQMEDGCIALPDMPGSGTKPDAHAIENATVWMARFGDDVGWRP